VLAFPLALVPSLLLLTAVFILLRLAGFDLASMSPPAVQVSLREFTGAVIFAPILETLLLALGLFILGVLFKRRLFVAAVSALLWGGFHGLVAPFWFFGTVWSFFIFSCAYLVWRERSFYSAFLAAAVPHMLVNLTVFILSVVSKHA